MLERAPPGNNELARAQITAPTGVAWRAGFEAYKLGGLPLALTSKVSAAFYRIDHLRGVR
jgi:hypothetical protein